MKRAPFLVAAIALPALALVLVGPSRAGSQGSHPSQRLERSDAGKLADQREAAESWLAERPDWDRELEHHREIQESAWRASTQSLEVDCGENGGAIVTGWSRDSIRVVARIEGEARSEERARELARSVRIVNRDGRLFAEGPDYENGESWRVTFDVLVPHAMALQIGTHNGPISVEGVDSRMELETVNGPLMLRGVSGDVRARTENGPLSVSLTGRSWRGAGLDASTENGPVRLSMPRGYSCMLETGTINGPMKMHIPIVVQGRVNLRNQQFTTKLGDGGPRVRATTTNGPAIVRYVDEGGEERSD
jgi:hypothetical protein